MNVEYRDYLKTVSLIKELYSTDFWEEEICFILNGDRDIQVKYQGSSSEYLKDLLIRANNIGLQENLLKKALKIFISNYRFKDLVYDVENETKTSELIVLIDLAREFCVKDAYIVELFVDFFILLFQEKLLVENNLLQQNNINLIFNGIMYLVDGFLPKNFEYNKVKNQTDSIYFFLKEYFNCINEFTIYNNDYLTNSIVFLLNYKFPLEISKKLVDNILKNQDSLEAFIYENVNRPQTFKNILLSIYKADNKGVLTKKMSELGIKGYSPLNNKVKKPSKQDLEDELLVYSQFRNKLLSDMSESIPDVNNILIQLANKQHKHGKATS